MFVYKMLRGRALDGLTLFNITDFMSCNQNTRIIAVVAVVAAKIQGKLVNEVERR